MITFNDFYQNKLTEAKIGGPKTDDVSIYVNQMADYLGKIARSEDGFSMDYNLSSDKYALLMKWVDNLPLPESLDWVLRGNKSIVKKFIGEFFFPGAHGYMKLIVHPQDFARSLSNAIKQRIQ